MTLIILSPLIFVAYLFSDRKIDAKTILLGLFVLVVTNLPLAMFEIRHNFSQTKAIYLSLVTPKDYIQGTSTGLAKLDRVMQLVNRNTMAVFSRYEFVHPSLAFVFLCGLLFYLIKIKKINVFWGVTFLLWIGLYIGFFSLNSKNPSEYYFNGMNIIWIIIASLGLLELGKFKYLLLALFFVANINYIIRYNPDKKGYVEKMNLIKEINADRIKHNYPCISVSYITSPGYDLGYRYLFYLEGMHVNKPKSLSPVYTIVYPHGLVYGIDKPFGSLGLIYPDYGRYNEKDIAISCSGENSNLTEPMFGYTQ